MTHGGFGARRGQPADTAAVDQVAVAVQPGVDEQALDDLCDYIADRVAQAVQRGCLTGLECLVGERDEPDRGVV